MQTNKINKIEWQHQEWLVRAVYKEQRRGGVSPLSEAVIKYQISPSQVNATVKHRPTASIFFGWVWGKKPTTTTKTALQSSKEGARCHTQLGYKQWIQAGGVVTQ